MIRFGLMLCLAAAPAFAECPTGADLASGIRVVDSDGTASVFRAAANGVVQQDITFADSFAYRNQLAKGVHVLQLAAVEDGVILFDTVEAKDYGIPPADLPVPAPSSRWSVNTTVTTTDGQFAEAQSQVWGPEAPLTIGDCTYPALTGQIAYKGDQLTISEGVYFFPTLGMSFLFSYDDTETDPQTFIPIRIEAVR